MKKYLLSILIIVFFVCHDSSAQWIRTNGPYGAGVNCFAVNGSDLYAGTVGGVYLSTDLWYKLD